MRDFVLALSGSVVGGLLALTGAFMQARLAAEKDARAELRGKLELLMEKHYADAQCNLEYLELGTERADCSQTQLGWKALTLANLYFPEMIEPLDKYGDIVTARQVARQFCDNNFPDKGPKRADCVRDALRKHKTDAQEGAIAAAAYKISLSLRP